MASELERAKVTLRLCCTEESIRLRDARREFWRRYRDRSLGREDRIRRLAISKEDLCDAVEMLHAAAIADERLDPWMQMLEPRIFAPAILAEWITKAIHEAHDVPFRESNYGWMRWPPSYVWQIYAYGCWWVRGPEYLQRGENLRAVVIKRGE